MESVVSRREPAEDSFKGHYKRHDYIKDSKSPQLSFKNQDQRKDLILKAFKESRLTFMTSKDFSFFVKDCSEKTIQRQLLDLVKEGVLKKDGERRWSRYSLKTSL